TRLVSSGPAGSMSERIPSCWRHVAARNRRISGLSEDQRLRHRWIIILAWPGLLAVARPGPAAEQVLAERLHHLRSGPVREWADFPEQAEAAELRLTFPSRINVTEQTLRIRHRDVKQTWSVRINDRE